ncbi:MAG: hypothetical protein M1503_09535 [Thaumarchaeota archaeon]|nr:hypothetical protein [Nitrososphaerota archaeon]MCL5318480.1 hypothetical protein [Nitrososphaerota archaeon]
MFSSGDIIDFTYNIYFDKETLEKQTLEEIVSDLNLGSFRTKNFNSLTTFFGKLTTYIPIIEFKNKEDHTKLSVFQNKIQFKIASPSNIIQITSENDASEKGMEKLLSKDSLNGISKDVSLVLGVFLGVMHNERRNLKSRVMLRLKKKATPFNFNQLFIEGERNSISKGLENMQVDGLQLTYKEKIFDSEASSYLRFFYGETDAIAELNTKMENGMVVDFGEIIDNRLAHINNMAKTLRKD